MPMSIEMISKNGKVSTTLSAVLSVLVVVMFPKFAKATFI